MLYVIDKDNFNGCIVAKMNDDKYINHTALKLDTYKIKVGLPGLVAVSVDEFEKMREGYIASRQTNFMEISEEEFYLLTNESKIERHFLSKELNIFYLLEEESAFGILPLYVCYKNKFYMAHKDIKLSIDSILSYIKTRKDITILSLEEAEHHTSLFNYMQEHNISEIMDFFDSAPDKVRLNGTDIPFIQIDRKNDRYIIYNDTDITVDKSLLQSILKHFYRDNFLSFFDKKCSVWSDYQEKCIAYRDGKGSTYTIWQYKY